MQFWISCVSRCGGVSPHAAKECKADISTDINSWG
jgi:hypothetical protein